MKKGFLLLLLSLVFFGCANDAVEEDADGYFISYVVGLSNPDHLNEDYPETYTILLDEEVVRIKYIDAIGPSKEATYTLGEFESTEDTVTFSYDSETVHFERISDSVFQDEEGLEYQVEVIEELEEFEVAD
jgi:hypothetical protein